MRSVQFTSGASLSSTFFIAIAAMDDEELFYTIDYIYENAAHPQNIYVGVSLLYKKKKFLRQLQKIQKKYPQVSYVANRQGNNDLSSLGVGKGRHKAAKLYDDQDYFIQIDSHSHFDKDWDNILLSLFSEAVEEVGDDRLVLTCIPPIYGYKNKEVFKPYEETRCPKYLMNSFFVHSVPQWVDFNSAQHINKRMFPSVKANSAFIMGTREFGKDTGVDENAIFYDEEFIYSVNIFGNGFAMVFPNLVDFPVQHLDGNMITKGHGRDFFLDYLDDYHHDLIHLNLVNNYNNFISNPSNKEKLDRYCSYAKIDPIRGYFSTIDPYVPRSYR